ADRLANGLGQQRAARPGAIEIQRETGAVLVEERYADQCGNLEDRPDRHPEVSPLDLAERVGGDACSLRAAALRPAALAPRDADLRPEELCGFGSIRRAGALARHVSDYNWFSCLQADYFRT